jgi:hypothetical protein
VLVGGATAGFAIGLTLLPLFVNGTALRTGNYLGHVADEFLERGNGCGIEIRAGYAHVRIEVGDGVRELRGVVLGPFG